MEQLHSQSQSQNEMCEHCPFRTIGLKCPRWPTNHTRYCEWVDPSHSGYRLDGREVLIRIASTPHDATVVQNGPSLWQKAKNLSGAIVDHVAAGLPHADDKTIEHRLEVCHTCEHFDTAYSRCRKCGCNMTIKVRWAEQRCPVGKW